MSCTSVRRLGFSVLSTGTGENDDTKPVATIVFVHGLRGHPRRTWESQKVYEKEDKEDTKRVSSRLFKWLNRKESTSSASIERDLTHVDANVTYWPQDLLPKTVPNARILTYGYNADVVGDLFKGANKNNITQHGRDLMCELDGEVSGEPIIFVAHSLGGILVKEGLHWSKFHIDPRYQELHRCTRNVIFMGVPHRGSDMASIGQIITRLANAALQDTNRPIVRTLEMDGEILERIHDEFMKMVYKEDFTVHSFQEARGLSGLKGFNGKVVNDSSSKLGHPLETLETIDENHMQMARFSDAEDPGYRKVSRRIATCVKDLQHNNKSERCAEIVDVHNPSPIVEGKRYFRVPHISNKYFVGRVKELEWLRAHLEGLAVGKGQQRVVIWGPGGSGKTQLVSTYALQSESKFSAVFWVTASSDSTLKRTYADLAVDLGLETSSASDQKAAIKSVRDWFTDHKRGDWLLVIDNADRLDEIDVEAFIPPTEKGSVIITSRDSEAEGFGPAIELGEMDSKDATTLLLRRAAIQHPTSVDETAATEITKLLGYLALAIEHAGAYIHSVRGSLQDYQLQFQHNRRTMLNKSPTISMHKESVFETFRDSYNAMKKRKPAAARLLCFFGFLDAEAFWEDTILTTHEDVTVFFLHVVADRLEYLDATQELMSFSLIRVGLEKGRKSVSLHPLVHYIVRAQLELEIQWLWKESVVTWLLQLSQATGANISLFPHVREQMQQINDLAGYPADPQRRRRIYKYIAILQLRYQHIWQNQGAMDELYRYCRMVSDVLEEESEDNEAYSIVAPLAVTNVRMNTVQYVNSSETMDQILLRYLLKRMTTSARLALEKGRNSGKDDQASGNTAGVEKSPSDNVDANTGRVFTMATLTTANFHEISASSKVVGNMVEGGNGSIEGTNFIEATIVKSGSVEGRLEMAERDSEKADPPRPVIAKKEMCSGGLPSHQKKPSGSDHETVDNQTGRPSSMTDPVYMDSGFRPKYLSDVFLSTTPPVRVQGLMECLTQLIKIYYGQKRTTEADILLSYSILPLSPSEQIEPQPEDQLAQLLIEAGRFAGQRDLESVLDVYQAIAATGDGSSQEVLLVTADYVTILNKVGRPRTAELVIKQVVYRDSPTEQLEQDLARQWQSLYIWVKKAVAVAQRLQGELKACQQTLLLTLQTAESFFGPHSLSTLHAAYLLHAFHSREGGTHQLQSEIEKNRYAEQFTEGFERLYGSDGERGELGNEGFQMGIILWAQGALEEATHVFDAFARMAARVLGESNILTKKAGRAGVVARKEWESSKASSAHADIFKFGTIIFPRKMDELALLLEDGMA